MRKLALALFILGITVVSLSAQKFGYLNSNELLSAMPEVKAAETELAEFQKKLETEGQTMLTKFEEDYLSYMNDVNEGVLSKVQMADREQKLGQDQQTITAFEQNAQQQMMQKRQQVLEPILKRVDEAIQAYGKENGYTFIFDSSTPGALLHAPEADDILDEIKAKLGIQ